MALCSVWRAKDKARGPQQPTLNRSEAGGTMDCEFMNNMAPTTVMEDIRYYIEMATWLLAGK